jgi:L-ascorbate metabolism protein UlaG (beta-lactamase superfamily)
VIASPAQHFSARTPFDRNRALWSGFVIEVEGRRILFAGDTGYGGHFQQIRDRLGPIDVALLPIGAYEPRWFMKDIHMDPWEAVQAHRDLEARKSIGMHFGTFRLTAEGIDEPVAALAHARREQQIPDDHFTVLDFGDSVQLTD